MNKNIAIQVENLSKAYQLGQIGTGTISRDLERFWTTKIRGKEDPFLKIGQTNDRTVKGDSDIVWSLKDINFEIEQGDAVGIIGRNGAGKSTLLKLLSRVTAPTTGNIKVKGRIASLLEVGTGFHPELTGRENIFLNGAILGMRKKEIARKLDEIIDFSGVERYIDTPVKRYSSGMYVRLAFAVAAHLESEILIVDEVLAVGDAEFQKKCLGKMGEVSKGEGRTILFVSHNMLAVQNLCNSGILLNNGEIKRNGLIKDVVNEYLGLNKTSTEWISNEYSNKEIYLSKVSISLLGRQPYLYVEVDCSIAINQNIERNSFLAFYITSQDLTPILEAIPKYNFINCSSKSSFAHVKTRIELNNFIPGIYKMGVWLGLDHSTTLDWQDDVVEFEIIDSPIKGRSVNFPKHAGFIVPNSEILDLRYE